MVEQESRSVGTRATHRAIPRDVHSQTSNDDKSHSQNEPLYVIYWDRVEPFVV